MRKYIKANQGNGKYIGMELYKFYDKLESYENDENYDEIEQEMLEDRAEEQDNYIIDFSEYYIVYKNNHNEDVFSLFESDDYDKLQYIIETMAIKDGIDVVAYTDHIEIIAYYSGNIEKAYLYPISHKTFSKFEKIVYNSDFDESSVLSGIISQYAWGGASILQILSSLSRNG